MNWKKYKKGKEIMKTIKEIRKYCRSLYYVEGLDGKEQKWQPFEDYETSQIEEYIKADTKSLCNFLGIKHIKKFRVYYKSTTKYYIDVEAEDYLNAQLKAGEIDGGDFEQEEGLKGTGNWDFDSVEEIEGE